MDFVNMQLREDKFGRTEDSVQAYEQSLTSWTDDVPTCRWG